MMQLHDPKYFNKKGDFLNRLIFDEIFSNFLVSSSIRRNILKFLKVKKIFDHLPIKSILKKVNYNLKIKSDFDLIFIKGKN